MTPERTAWGSPISFPNADAHVLGRAYVGPSRISWPNNVHASPFTRRKSRWEQDDFLLHLVALNVCIVKREQRQHNICPTCGFAAKASGKLCSTGCTVLATTSCGLVAERGPRQHMGSFSLEPGLLPLEGRVQVWPPGCFQADLRGRVAEHFLAPGALTPALAPGAGRWHQLGDSSCPPFLCKLLSGWLLTAYRLGR